MTSPNMQTSDDGFNYRLFPATTGKPSSLIVYLHGANGDTEQLTPEFLRELQNKIPGADVIAIQAPIKVIKSKRFPDPVGYIWFPYGGSLTSQLETWYTHIFKHKLTVAEQIDHFVQHQLEQRGLTNDNLVYYGYSMGGIVALQTGLTADHSPAAIVARGGSVIPFTKAKNKPPVFLQMGANDGTFVGMIPTPAKLPKKGFLKEAFNAIAKELGLDHQRSVQRLEAQHVPVTQKVYPNQAHEQNYGAWKEAVDFMAKALAQPK
jgi:predicted esterase